MRTEIQRAGHGFALMASRAALAGLLAGCSARTSGMEGSATSAPSPEGVVQSSQYVIVNNPGLARGIQVVELKSEFVNDILKAQVSLVAKYSKTLKFQYKFRWFTAQGMELASDAQAWIPLMLFGNESKTVQAVAPNAAAREFKIEIRSM